MEAGCPSEVARPYLQGDAHHSYWDLSEFLGSRQQGRLVEREGERALFGGGASEKRSWRDTRPGAEGTARFPGRAKPSCLLSQSRR